MNLALAYELLKKYMKEGITSIQEDASIQAERKDDVLAGIVLKGGHSVRAVGVAKHLLALHQEQTPLALNSADKELMLCAVLLHDIGDFYIRTQQDAYDHAKTGANKIRQEKSINIDKEEMFLLTTMIEQHSPLNPVFTGNEKIDFGIKLLRDADFLEDASYLIEDMYAPSRAGYFNSRIKHGPLDPKNLEAFMNNEFVRYQNLHTFGDFILLYGAKKATLGLDVSKEFWRQSGMEQRFLDAAYESERRGKHQPAQAPRPPKP